MTRSPLLKSWLAGWLPRRRRLFARLRLSALWQPAYDFAHRGNRPLRLRLHGYDAWLNPGNPYPIILAENPLFNRPLTELVRQLHQHLGRRLGIIDVGASIGNTVLLLHAEAAHAIDTMHCVEGDPDFFALLEANTQPFPRVQRLHAMLAAEPGTARALVHHHAGTAAAVGHERIGATTLDELLLSGKPHCDVLKIDVDGSDGEVLRGARQLLARDQPATIFEWHPHLIAQAGNDCFAAFATLRAAGYENFLWFTNRGTFSHFSTGEPPEVAKWEKFLRALQPHGDPHFDVIALPPHLRSLEPSLASFGVAPPAS